MSMRNVGIIALGAYVPPHKLTNADLEKMVETSDEWITSRTGIRERRIARRDELNSHLAIRAAKEALKNAKLIPAKVELIVVA
ncbi:MAG TPA: 3-oxoacyl-ACP synthase, partial [Candidatus Omnitrophota bacterium]|nr:3-oxoacyl-ACP synthase [Candidatus Omnitrophota bacterium]